MNKCNKVIDLKTFVPFDNKKGFFLDTNVLYWYANPRFSPTSQPNSTAKIYYNFVDKLIVNKNPLFTSVYNLTELLNVIEKNEYEIYSKLNPSLPLTKKEFRARPAERATVERIMRTALNNVRSICTITDFNFTQSTVDEFISDFSNHRCDVFDFAILKNCIDTNQLNIISDDGDFSTIEHINMYTANENVLNVTK